jgi:primosomal replication protein N
MHSECLSIGKPPGALRSGRPASVPQCALVLQLTSQVMSMLLQRQAALLCKLAPFFSMRNAQKQLLSVSTLQHCLLLLKQRLAQRRSVSNCRLHDRCPVRGFDFELEFGFVY